MIEQYGTGKDKFFTDSRYWDCSCKNNYIHLKKKGNYCPKCKYWEDEMPDSRVNEIKELYDPKKDKAIKKKAENV